MRLRDTLEETEKPTQKPHRSHLTGTLLSALGAISPTTILSYAGYCQMAASTFGLRPRAGNWKGTSSVRWAPIETLLSLRIPLLRESGFCGDASIKVAAH
jgi:hypothetical protein